MESVEITRYEASLHAHYFLHTSVNEPVGSQKSKLLVDVIFFIKITDIFNFWNSTSSFVEVPKQPKPWFLLSNLQTRVLTYSLVFLSQTMALATVFELPCDQQSPFWLYAPQNWKHDLKESCTPRSIEALLTRAKRWKQPNWETTYKWMTRSGVSMWWNIIQPWKGR